MTTNHNYIIVGAGLAGTILADTLISRGKTVLLIDEQHIHNASKVAAGLYNPVVFKRLVKSWMADELIPFMDNYYSLNQEKFNSTFYHKKQIVKVFAEENEKAFWLKKMNEDVGRYLGNTFETKEYNACVNAPLGLAEVLSAGNLDTTVFLNSLHHFFYEKKCMVNEKFDYNDLKITENKVLYRNYTAEKIIFCEGYKSVNNPYFGYLPFKLTKGEVLTIKAPQLADIKNSFDKVINKGCFILPVADNLYKAGATYEWNDLTENITEKGKNELIDKLKKILTVPFEVIEHKAGVRPTISDRRPLLGLHPEHKSLAIFNGLGTKGVMLAPYFANHFADFLEQKIVLNKEVDIARFN